jgi:hypothetical protein
LKKIIGRVRQSTGLPIAHAGMLAPDGSGYFG